MTDAGNGMRTANNVLIGHANGEGRTRTVQHADATLTLEQPRKPRDLQRRAHAVIPLNVKIPLAFNWIVKVFPSVAVTSAGVVSSSV